jgi:hypothetical protein
MECVLCTDRAISMLPSFTYLPLIVCAILHCIPFRIVESVEVVYTGAVVFQYNVTGFS